jgi:hypothetical protein
MRGRNRPAAPIPLTPVGPRPLIEHLLEFFFRGGVESASVCAAEADYHRYLDWLRGCDYTGRVEILDGSANGSAGPLHDLGRFARRGRLSSGIFVTAGDRFYDFPFGRFAGFCDGRDGDVVCVSGDRADAGGRCGTAAVTANERVIDFAAGARGRRRGLSAIPLIRLSADTIACLDRYLAEGNEDACIGSFLEWSYRFRPLYAWRLEGRAFHLSGPAAIRRVASRFEMNGGI